jgi:hypothetical protein
VQDSWADRDQVYPQSCCSSCFLEVLCSNLLLGHRIAPWPALHNLSARFWAQIAGQQTGAKHVIDDTTVHCCGMTPCRHGEMCQHIVDAPAGAALLLPGGQRRRLCGHDGVAADGAHRGKQPAEWRRHPRLQAGEVCRHAMSLCTKMRLGLCCGCQAAMLLAALLPNCTMHNRQIGEENVCAGTPSCGGSRGRRLSGIRLPS